jgi:hypothetical protein
MQALFIFGTTGGQVYASTDALEADTRCSGAPSATPAPAAVVLSCASSPAKGGFSLEPPETPLPKAVAEGDEPLLVVGAMAGG